MENQTRNPVSANAILCTLHVSVWAGTKTDRDAGDDLADHKHAKRGSAKVIKSLLGDCIELREVLRIGSAARTALKESTLPWIDRGARLVPVSRYTKIQGMLLDYQHAFYTALDTLVDVYSDRIAQARVGLGAMFNEADYPHLDDIRSRFTLDFVFAPVPDNGDFRIKVADDAIADLQSQYAKAMDDTVKEGIGGAMSAACAVFEKLSERLTVLDAHDGYGSKPKLHASLVESIHEALDLVRDGNVIDNPYVEDAHRQLRNVANTLDVDELRASARIRQSAQQDIKDAIANLPSLGF
jgi:hypothetical protein